MSYIWSGHHECHPLLQPSEPAWDQTLLVEASADKHRPMFGGCSERGIVAEDVLFHPVLLDHRAGHMGVGTAYLLG
jgi:hypothetical protein